MNWTDDDLMAHADGEGNAERRAALDAAMLGDAGLRDRWMALLAQRQRVAAAYDDVLQEPVPDRLLALLSPAAAPAAAATAPAAPSAAPVVDLTQARADREVRRSLSWAQWGGMAACLVLGLALGLQLAPRGEGLLSDAGGQLVAGAPLAQALTGQLASDIAGAASAGGVRVQLSFVDKGGRYCRTFQAQRLAGLACRDDGQWTVLTTAMLDPAAPGSEAALRQANSAVPQAVLDAVDAQISGDALNADQERAARDRGWRR